MPDVPSDEHQLLLPQQHIRASGQIVQLTPVDIDQLKRLVLFAAKIKIAGALLIKKCVKPLQLQFAPRAGEFLRRWHASSCTSPGCRARQSTSQPLPSAAMENRTPGRSASTRSR